MPDIATERILGLRTCGPNGESNDGRFRWPLEIGATVEAPDWNPAPECGGGLHFLPWGVGDGWLLDWSEDAHWLVIETEAWIRIDEKKAKCQSATVRFVGRQVDATDYLLANGAYGRAVTGANATAGHHGTATAGHHGTATAGDYGTATAGDRGTIIIRWHDGRRYRLTVGYVGEDEIEADTPYRCGEDGRLVKATAGRGWLTAGDRGTATAGDRGTMALVQTDGKR